MADKTLIITKAREITGNKTSVAVGEQMVPDAAILALLDPIVAELAKSAGAGSTSTKEVVFAAVPAQQDYAVAAHVGGDVAAISEVLRSGAYVPDFFTDSDDVEPVTGLPTNRYGRVSVGWQGDVMDVIIGMRRKQHDDRYSWQVVSKADGDYLRLYPVPGSEEVVAVSYVVDGTDISDVAEEFESVLVYAACTAILDAQINRTMSDRATTSTWGEAQAARLKVLQAQRDRYEAMYKAARDAKGA